MSERHKEKGGKGGIKGRRKRRKKEKREKETNKRKKEKIPQHVWVVGVHLSQNQFDK